MQQLNESRVVARGIVPSVDVWRDVSGQNDHTPIESQECNIPKE